MTASTPLIRNIEVLVGPLSEDKGGGPKSSAVRVFSDGSREALRVRFNAKKTLLGSPNASVVEIYNLPPDTRARLRTTLARVLLSTGHRGEELSQLASGALQSITHSKVGPDIVTKLGFLDGYGGMTRGLANRSYGGPVTVASAVRDLAGDLPGVTLGRVDIDGTFGLGGRVFAGRAADALDDLSAQYGFSWSVQDGVFQALSDLRAFPRSTDINAENRTLISAQPILNGPMQIQTGVEIQAVLDARVKPGESVQLTSGTNPAVNGRLKVHNADFDGDTADVSWTMTLQSFRVF
ncbi:MAG: hypothetical protein JKY94_17795 [Rhodobacteraceae bacterium]|nr:hypothetical protein [Paracoccaceae bacterium]